MASRNEDERFRRISSAAYNRLTKTANFRRMMKIMKDRGFSEQYVRSHVKSDVLNGRFLDCEDFLSQHTGIPGLLRKTFGKA